MTDERKAKPTPPPRGMIEIDGRYEIRRYGLVTVQRELTCIYGHRFKVGDERPFEVAKPCGHMEHRGSQIACGARLYMFVSRQRMLWAMDVTLKETLMILQHSMESEEIIDYFGVGFPADMKISRLPG
jgi:hypothetical protein